MEEHVQETYGSLGEVPQSCPLRKTSILGCLWVFKFPAFWGIPAQCGSPF